MYKGVCDLWGVVWSKELGMFSYITEFFWLRLISYTNVFGCDFFYLHVDVFILVWGRASGAYLLFQHVQHCVVVGCFGLLGLCTFLL